MNKLLMFLFSFIMLFTFGCDSDDTITGGVINPEPELLGCEAASFYDWTDFEFSTSLDGGANTWIAFDFDETTLFSIDLNQAGFQCLLFEACDGENGSPPPLYNFSLLQAARLVVFKEWKMSQAIVLDCSFIQK